MSVCHSSSDSDRSGKRRWPARPTLPILVLPMKERNRRKFVALVLAFVLLLGQPARAANRSWNKIRYQAGTIDVKVNPFDWNTTLSIAQDGIELNFAGRKRTAIGAGEITALSYGEAAYRRISTSIEASGRSTPVPLFGILHSSDRAIGIEYTSAGVSHGALLLMLHRDICQDVLRALANLTGKPIEGAP